MRPHRVRQVLAGGFDGSTRQRSPQDRLEVGGLDHTPDHALTWRAVYGRQGMGHFYSRPMTFSHASHPAGRCHGEPERRGGGCVSFTLDAFFLRREQDNLNTR